MKNNSNKFLLTVMLFTVMVITTFMQLITSDLSVKLLAKKKEPLAGAKVFIKNLHAGSAYVTSALNDLRYSIDCMKLQHLFL